MGLPPSPQVWGDKTLSPQNWGFGGCISSHKSSRIAIDAVISELVVDCFADDRGSRVIDVPVVGEGVICRSSDCG